MNIFVSGGCKNGKSLHAQELARDMAAGRGAALYYVATMIPTDQEDRTRIRRHLAARDGWGFATLEQGTDLCALLERPDVDRNGVFLMDSVTALLSNEMFPPESEYDPDAGARVAADLKRFARETGSTVFVSDYIYSDARVFDSVTENYRRALALCDRTLAAVCDRVIETGFGFFKELK